MVSDRPHVTLGAARDEDASDIAEIWQLGCQDGHLGFVPQELVDVRDGASFRTRASERISDTTVATVDGAVAGFVLVVDDEVEQVYVSAAYRGTGVATNLARRGGAPSLSERPRERAPLHEAAVNASARLDFAAMVTRDRPGAVIADNATSEGSATLVANPVALRTRKRRDSLHDAVLRSHREVGNEL